MSNPDSGNTRGWLWLAVVLTISKLWLTRAQPIFAISDATLDDRLFLELAQSLVRGEWLGAYTQATLAKGPGYPLFIAIVFYLAIPLGLAQQALYATACAIFARAFRPVASLGTQGLIYLVLLWNPMSYEAPTLCRIMRQHLVTPLAIIIFAGLIALYLRRHESFRRMLRWALLLGLSIGVFWITREESVWILPSIALLAGALLAGSWQTSQSSFRTMIGAGLIVIVCAALPATFTSWENSRHYGWFGTVEFKAPAFKAAYGALQRVAVGPAYPQVPVSKEAREALYPLSPAFAQLKPWLEREAWTKEGPPPHGDQIRGGWFIWALRDSVDLSGHAPDAKTALQFYQTLADEVNAACDSGQVPSFPRRDSLMPRWHAGDAAEIARTTIRFADFVASFSSFNAYPRLSIGDREQLKLFNDLTGDRLTSSVKAPEIERPNQTSLALFKLGLLQTIGSHLRVVLYTLCFVAHGIAALRLWQMLSLRRVTFPMIVAGAAWGGVATFILINAMVHVLSFPLTAVSTFSPVYPLLIIFYLAVFWDAFSAWARPLSLNRGQTSI